MRERFVADIPRELAQVETKGRMLEGYASVFDYPIDSGTQRSPQTTFVRPGAFTRTLKNNRDQIQVMFNHGHDPRYGELPIGTIKELHEDSRGLRASVELHDGPDNENIRSALASGALRAMSIQFETIQEDFSDDHTIRNLRELKLWEFGPVAFPANAAATASLHSLAALAVDLEGQLEKHWDGDAALGTCSTAAEFRKIAFERNNESDPDTAAHWTLPHHPRPGAGPDSTGVAAALAALHGARGGKPPDLKQSVTSVENHLQAHQSESSSAETRESTLDEARLTWLREIQRRYEQQGEELALEAVRMVKR
jgi:HK97 family phage prohead protease